MKQSRQKINRDRSAFNVHTNTVNTCSGDRRIIGFPGGNCHLMYLGFPIGHTKKRKTHFVEFIKEVQNKVQHGKENLAF